MSIPKGPAVQSKTQEGIYSSGWRFLAEAVDLSGGEGTLEVQTYKDLIQLYGVSPMLWDATMIAGNTMNISTRHMQVISEGAFQDTIDLVDATVVTGAGLQITVVSNKNSLRVGFTLNIPALYCGTSIAQKYRCTTKTLSAPGEWTYELDPLLATSEIAVEIPIGQKLMIGQSMFAAGTQQPAGLVKDWYNHYHTTTLMKESIYYEGGQIALKEQGILSQDSNGSNLRARAQAMAQMSLRLQLNDALISGSKNTNSLTQANRSGELNDILGADGLLPTMWDKSMKQYYTGVYNEDHFANVKFLLASQKIMSAAATMFHGPEIGLGIENGQLNVVKEYSGGSDLYDKLKGVGFGISEVYYNKQKTFLVDLPEFSDPTSYGIDNYNYTTMAAIFPDAKSSVTTTNYTSNGASTGSKVTSLPNVSIGYLNYGGEDRKLISGTKAGVNGLGIPFSDDWDDSAEYLLCEMMPIFTAMNQAILVLRTDV